MRPGVSELAVLPNSTVDELPDSRSGDSAPTSALWLPRSHSGAQEPMSCPP